MLLHRQILVPKLLHFFNDFLEIQKLLYFSKSRAHQLRNPSDIAIEICFKNFYVNWTSSPCV